jgi:hypothetical protein
MKETSENPIYAPAVIDFIRVAAEYCRFLEQEGGPADRQALLDRMTKFLPMIYLKATLLPDMEATGEEELPEVVTEEDYNYVQRVVWERLRGDDSYLEVFTPDMQFSDTPIAASISEDLADIYQDLKNFVAVFADRNEALMSDAIAQVRDHFASYWGQKLVNALRPLHELRYGSPKEVDGEESEGTI